jgi:hypothetical protein
MLPAKLHFVFAMIAFAIYERMQRKLSLGDGSMDGKGASGTLCETTGSQSIWP